MRDINIAFLEYIRKDRGLTQVKVSNLLNKYDSYYTGKVNGDVRFNTQDLVQLIEILGMTNEEVLNLLGVL